MYSRLPMDPIGRLDQNFSGNRGLRAPGAENT